MIDDSPISAMKLSLLFSLPSTTRSSPRDQRFCRQCAKPSSPCSVCWKPGTKEERFCTQHPSEVYTSKCKVSIQGQWSVWRKPFACWDTINLRHCCAANLPELIDVVVTGLFHGFLQTKLGSECTQKSTTCVREGEGFCTTHDCEALCCGRHFELLQYGLVGLSRVE